MHQQCRTGVIQSCLLVTGPPDHSAFATEQSALKFCVSLDRPRCSAVLSQQSTLLVLDEIRRIPFPVMTQVDQLTAKWIG